MNRQATKENEGAIAVKKQKAWSTFTDTLDNRVLVSLSKMNVLCPEHLSVTLMFGVNVSCVLKMMRVECVVGVCGQQSDACCVLRVHLFLFFLVAISEAVTERAEGRTGQSLFNSLTGTSLSLSLFSFCFHKIPLCTLPFSSHPTCFLFAIPTPDKLNF